MQHGKLPSSLTKRNGCNLDNSKHSHPVPPRRYSLHPRPRTRRGNLGRIEPRDGKPADAHEELVDEDEDRRCVGRRARPDRDEDRDHDEAKAQTRRAYKQQRPATKPIHEEHGDGRPDQVRALRGAAQDERKTPIDAHVLLDDDGEVVVDHVGARELLEELYRDDKQQTAQILCLAPREELGEAEGPALLLLLETDADVEDDAVDVSVITRLAVEGGHDVASLFEAVVLDEPARCFGEANDLEDEEDGKDGLESQREAPLERGFVEAGAVVGPVVVKSVQMRPLEKKISNSPVSNDDAQDSHSTLQGEQCAADMGRGAFAQIHGCCGRVHAVADTRDDTANYELGDGIRCT